jgi:signal transduction histidine kinase
MNADLKQARDLVSELLQSARDGVAIPPEPLETLSRVLHALDTDERTQASNGGDFRGLLVDNAEFWKTAIHELRTPMTSIRGYSDMLFNPSIGGTLTDMQKQLIGVVRTNSRRMENLLSDFSVLNRLRAGVLISKPKLDTVKNIALSVQKRAEPLVEELGRSFALDVPAGLPMMQTDGEHLGMALFKLVDNGLRYSPPETGKVTLKVTADETTVILEVIDNGIGISADDLPKLGKAFFRADHELVRSYKGSGLGLPIAYSLIAALGGQIRVRSTLGEGTTWAIRLAGMGVR